MSKREMDRPLKEKRNDTPQVNRQEPQSLFGQLEMPITETRFTPDMTEHLDLLSSVRSNEHLAEHIMHLQRTYGNNYVSRLLSSPYPVQKKPVDLGRIKTFLEEHPGLQHLFGDIKDDMSNFDIMDTLLRNFVNRSDFNYTGQRAPIWSNEGDCFDLCSQFYLIAKDCFGIELQEGHANEPCFVPGPTKQIGDKRTGNANGGQAWIFDEHYWLIYAGSSLDVLFGHWGLGHFPGTRALDEQGYEYYLFKDGPYYFNKMSKDRSDIYTSNPKKKAKNKDELPAAVK
jgi:hypothetical protein